MFEKVSERLRKNSVIDEHGCRIWLGAKQRENYGVIRNEHQKVERAHRLVYRIVNNLEKIPNKLYILHKCDTPPCINPEHLFLGTQFDNLKDMTDKGRRGVWHPVGKLNPNYKHGKTVRII